VHLVLLVGVLHSHRHNKTSRKNHDDKWRRLDAPVQTSNSLQDWGRKWLTIEQCNTRCMLLQRLRKKVYKIEEERGQQLNNTHCMAWCDTLRRDETKTQHTSWEAISLQTAPYQVRLRWTCSLLLSAVSVRASLRLLPFYVGLLARPSLLERQGPIRAGPM
jgi:hypothetical protein